MNNIEKDPIAIIGIGCRFAGDINSAEYYWESLLNKFDAIVDVPADRWNKDIIFNNDFSRPGKLHIKKGGFISNIDKFDAHFFNISPNEANHMDPQQRILMEVSYEAIEDAGLKLDDLSNSNTGVYIGICGHDYGEITTQVKERSNITSLTNTGISHCIAANRISYFYNLKGPSIAIDTACSSSLTAIHLACRSIWNNESNMAFTGGVNILLRPEATMGFSKGNYLSPDCKCKSFDQNADGYVRSEGAGIIILKPLSQAIKDNDKIYSLIVGTSINQDGRTQGLTVPNVDSQKEMILKAYKDANIDPSNAFYIEAHGTGTPIGDPIEAEAIGKTIGINRKKGNICYLGSVKTNIGHLETASGVAGLIKLALILKNRMVVPNLHFKQPNQKIKFDEYNLKVPTELIKINDPDKILYGGVNSFGFGGSNAHIVLKEPGDYSRVNKDDIKLSSDKLPNIFVLTSKNLNSLKNVSIKYLDYLKNNECNITDFCYSAYSKRTFFEYRLAATTNNKNDLINLLENFIKNDQKIELNINKQLNEKKIVFVYSGQGPQWWAMGRQLIKNVPLFFDEIKKIDSILKKVGWMKNENISLLEEILKNEKDSRINEANIAQPAIFAIQIALTKFWNHLGIYPDAILGHSLGEITASYICGAVSLVDAIRILISRMHFQTKAENKGGMLAVGLSYLEVENEIKKYEKSINIAVINGPKSITLSGDLDSINSLADELTKKNIFNRIIKLNIPYHSYMMDEYKDDFLDVLGEINPENENISIFSTVSALKISGKEFNSNHWYKNIRQPVLFYQAVKNMINENYNVFLEISPHPILMDSIQETFDELNKKGIVVYSLKRKEDEIQTIFKSLCKLFSYGYNFNWKNIYGNNHNFISLPSYSWDKERYWCESEKSRKERIGENKHPHLGKCKKFINENNKYIWEIILNNKLDTYINDHKVQGPIVYPAAGQIELVSSIAKLIFSNSFYYIENINFISPIFISDNSEPPLIQFEINSDEGDFCIFSKQQDNEKNWILNSYGKINFMDNNFISERILLKDYKENIKENISVERFYDGCQKGGLLLGETFKGIKNLWNKDYESIGEIEMNEKIENDISYFILHPAVLDSCLQSSLGILNNKKSYFGVFIPIFCEKIKFYKKQTTKKLWTYSRISEFSDKKISVNIWIFDEHEDIICEIQGLNVKYLEGSNDDKSEKIQDFFYKTKWKFKKRSDDKLFRNTKNILSDFNQIKDYLINVEKEIINRDENEEYSNKFTPEIDNLCISFIINLFKSLDIQYSISSKIIIDDVLNKISSSNYNRLINHLFNILEKYNYIRKHSDYYEIIKDTNIKDNEEEIKRLQKKYKNFPHELILLNRCAPNLKKVLLGELNPIELLFPEKEWDSVIQFYNEAYSFKQSNEMIYKAINKLIERLPEDQDIRILEIGAGTGGMTNGILSVLPMERTEYFYTDLSNMFLIKAKERFKKYSFINYKVLDIEKDIEDQFFDKNSFDIVIASDVIHATSDIKKTLKNIKKLLASNGLLIMLEVTKVPLYADLVFGLTSGWWLYNDINLRKNHSALIENDWLKVLNDMEFSETLSYMHNIKNDSYPQSIFISRGPNLKIISTYINPKKRDNNWIIFNDDYGLGDKLCDELISNNDKVIKINRGNDFIINNDSNIIFNYDSYESMKRLFDKIDINNNNISGIVYFWPIVKLSCDNISLEIINETQKKVIIPLLDIVNIIENNKNLKMIPIKIICNGSDIINKNDKKVNIINSSIWGFSRVIANEYSNIPLSIIDLSYDLNNDEILSLARELIASDKDIEIAFRGNTRFINIFEKNNYESFIENSMKEVPSSNYPYDLKIINPGILDSLILSESKKNKINDNEVEIEVFATGLNYRDIMLGMNLLHEDLVKNGYFEDKFGLECSGKIIKIGKHVTEFKIGDEVIAIAKNSISGITVVNKDLIVKKPENIDFKEAATIPISYITAYYIINYLCNMKENEKILIHSACGGLGLALINLAKLYNAEIYATVSTEEKRKFLLSLGIKNIYNSRTFEFKEQILKDTNGKGVDIVINTLSGNLIESSFKCLSSFGRFVELGKTDVSKNKQIGLKYLSNNISYFVVDLEKICKEKPSIIKNIFKDITKFIANNIISPIKYTQFSIRDVKEAILNMSQSKHIGKIIIETNEKNKTVQVLPPDFLYFDEDSLYLITGGCSGFGLSVADWMVSKKARNILLVSRNGIKTYDDEKIIEGMQKKGAQVYILKKDISNKDEMDSLFDFINEKNLKLKGIIHSAMILDDMPLSNLNYDRYMKVFNPKALGAWNLHSASLNYDLDFFIMFSSVSSIIGNPGQANYAAGNSFLDKLSFFRRSLGLPSSTINWGAIGETGFFVRSEKLGTKLLNQGFKSFSLKQSTNILGKIIIQKPIQSIVMDLDWKIFKNFFPDIVSSNKFFYITDNLADNINKKNENINSIKDILSNSSTEKRFELLKTKLSDFVSRILGTIATKIDYDESLMSLGFDSLMANQLRNWIMTNLIIDYHLMKIMKGPSINELTNELLEEMFPANGTSKDDNNKLFIEEKYPLLSVVKQKEYYPLSSNQKRLFALNYSNNIDISYNMTYVLKSDKNIDIDKIENAINLIIKKHEILRTTFDFINNEPVQILNKNLLFKIEKIKNIKNTIDETIKYFIKPFDLKKMPLFRVGTFKFKDNTYIIFDMHHIITDGLSMSILVNELISALQDKNIGILKFNYFSYVKWQQNFLESKELNKQKKYWLNIFADKIKSFDLPTDYTRSIIKTSEGDSIYMEIDKDIFNKANEFVIKNNTSLFTLLFSVLNIILSKYSGSNDIIIGTPVLGRSLPEFQEIIGLFVNTLAIRTSINPDISFKDFINMLKFNIIESFENQDYQFEQLVSDLNIQRIPGKNPLFDVMFVLQNNINSNLEINNNIKLTPYRYDNNISKFDLLLESFKEKNKIILRMEYNLSLFKKKTIVDILENYIKILKFIVENENFTLKELLVNKEIKRIENSLKEDSNFNF